MIRFVIVDYKIGNHKSLEFFLKKMGHEVKVSSSFNDIKSSDIIILPGIGAFPAAMAAMKELKLDKIIINEYLRNKPIIGICLGMQLLATKSSEFEETKGLNIIPGKITPLKQSYNIIIKLFSYTCDLEKFKALITLTIFFIASVLTALFL